MTLFVSKTKIKIELCVGDYLILDLEAGSLVKIAKENFKQLFAAREMQEPAEAVTRPASKKPRPPTRLVAQRLVAQRSPVSYKQFTVLLEEKYPHEPKQGMKRALLDWNRKERAEGKTDRKIVEGTEQYWRKKGEVPAWAINYLRSISVLPKRPVSKDWNHTERGFLKRLIKTRPELSYIQMGEICSKKFHREIGENSIKGMADRWGFGKNS